MRGLQVWSEGRKRRVGAALKGLPWVARGGKHGMGAAAAAAAAAAHEREGEGGGAAKAASSHESRVEGWKVHTYIHMHPHHPLLPHRQKRFPWQ